MLEGDALNPDPLQRGLIGYVHVLHDLLLTNQNNMVTMSKTLGALRTELQELKDQKVRTPPSGPAQSGPADSEPTPRQRSHVEFGPGPSARLGESLFWPDNDEEKPRVPKNPP